MADIGQQIREAAIARGIDPEVALRIANAESDLVSSAKNPRSSARGLFQITDDTWKFYGGDPKKRKDTAENIRVGLNVIEGNREEFRRRYGREPSQSELYTMHVFGKTGGPMVLSSDPNTELKELLSPKVLKANPQFKSMTVAELSESMRKKMKEPAAATAAAPKAPVTAGPAVAPAAPKETIRPQAPVKQVAEESAPKRPEMSRDFLASMGPSYMAALAASTLGDLSEDREEGETDADYIERITQERLAAQEEPAVAPPRRLLQAELSYQSPFETEEPVKLAFGGLPYKPSAMLPSAVKTQVATAQQQWDAYNKAAADYNRRVDEYNNLLNQYNSAFVQYEGQPVTYYAAGRGNITPTTSQRGLPTFHTSQQGKTYTPVDVGGGNFLIRTGEFMKMAAPREPGGGPSQPSTSAEQVQAAVDLAKAKQRRLQFVYDVLEDPERYNLSIPKLFADGGEAISYETDLEPTFGQRMGANVSDILTNIAVKGIDLASTDRSKMSAAHKIYLDTFGMKENQAPVTKDYFNQEELDALAELIQRKGGTKGSMTYDDYKTLMKGRSVKQYPLLSGRLDPYLSLSKSLGQFNYEYDPKTKSYKILDEYDFNPLTTKEGIRTDSDFVGDYVSDRLFDPYAIARTYAGRKMPPGKGRKVDLSVPAKRPVKRADGSPVYGEVADTGPVTADTRAALSLPQGLSASDAFNALRRIYGAGASNLESNVRGSAAAIPGFVGDIGQEFDIPYMRRAPTTKQILKAIPRATTPTKEAEGFEEVGTYLPLPVSPSAVKGSAKAMMAAIKSAGPQIESTLMRMAPGAEPMNIVRPSGGLFPSSKKIGEEHLSNLDEQIDNVVRFVNLEGADESLKAAVNFLDTKIRDYFRKQAGSVSDPVREALISGKIKIPKDSLLENKMPQALIDAARNGDVTAMAVLEKQLDSLTGVKATIVKAQANIPRWEQSLAIAQEYKQSILDQIKRNPQLIPDSMLLRLSTKNAEKLSPQQSAEKVATVRKKLADNPNLFNTVFEEKFIRLLNADYPQGLSVEDYATIGSKNPYLARALSTQEGIMALRQDAPFIDTSSFSQILGMSLPEITKYAQTISPKDLQRMSVPELMAKVIPMAQKNNSVAPLVSKAQRLLDEKKPVPKNVATYGTKDILPRDAEGFIWREIVDPSATLIQAAMMKNSIGSYSVPGTYGALGKGLTSLQNGDVRIFGLYDKNDQLVSNLEYITKKAKTDRAGEVAQFKGNGTATGGTVDPEKYLKQGLQIFDYLKPTQLPKGIKQLLEKNKLAYVPD